MGIEGWPGLVLGDVIGSHRSEVHHGTYLGERVVVRRSRRGSASLCWELDQLAQVSAVGIGVAEPIPTAAGDLHSDGFVVQHFVDGRPPTTDRDWLAIADALRRLHIAAGDVEQRPGCCTVTELGRCFRSVDADVTTLPDDVHDLVLSIFDAASDAPVSVVHGDPGAANIRIGDDELITLWFV